MSSEVRELRPNENERLQSELFSVMREMVERDPDALNRILETLNRALKPVVDKCAALS